MDLKQPKTGSNRNKHTTNEGVVDTALRYWEAHDHISRGILGSNLNSYFRDRCLRILERLRREAIRLGGDLNPPNFHAFDTIQSTKALAKDLGVLNG